MAALRSRCVHYIFCPVVSSIFFFFIFSPNLSRRRLDVYHDTSTHGVHGLSANLECMSENNVLHAARWKYTTQNIAILAPSHDFIFATEAYINNRKKNLLNRNISCTCRYNMVNFGILAAETVSFYSLGHPCKFERVSRLGSVTARHSSSGLQPNFAALYRGRNLFGRATITLGIGPHSSFHIYCDFVRKFLESLLICSTFSSSTLCSSIFRKKNA